MEAFDNDELAIRGILRDALEAEGPFDLKSSRRALWRWMVPTLAAACVAVVASFQLGITSESASLEQTIRLLSEADGWSLESDYGTPIEMLLAWQEAPLNLVED